ncbi:MAG: M16 family metallopeptidase [Hyphomicrobiaceae bacterium]
MTIEMTALANGVRVVSHLMPHVETVSLGVFIGTGARHELEQEHGISHLLEHMAFKGTARRTARQIAEEIEQVGGELNAATSLESTAYYARVLKGDDAVALDILADILRNPLFDKDDLEREREVILQEIAGINDSPEELAFDLLHDAAFPGQPVGRPIIGTPDSVVSFTAGDLGAFLASRYIGPRTVVSAAGAVDHAALTRHAEALFGSMPATAAAATVAARYVGGQRSLTRTFEQSHLLVGFPSPSYNAPDFFAAQVFTGLFGGGMSSRLFQEIRETRGLCYAIYATAWGFEDAGLLAVHAATGEEQMAELIAVLGVELKRAASEQPGAAEVQRAKAQMKAGLLMSLESTGARAEQMARQLLIAGRLVPTDELIQRVDDVTGEAVRAVAERILTVAPPSIAVVGAGRKSEGYAATAARGFFG